MPQLPDSAFVNLTITLSKNFYMNASAITGIMLGGLIFGMLGFLVYRDNNPEPKAAAESRSISQQQPVTQSEQPLTSPAQPTLDQIKGELEITMRGMIRKLDDESGYLVTDYTYDIKKADSVIYKYQGEIRLKLLKRGSINDELSAVVPAKYDTKWHIEPSRVSR